MMDFLNSVKSLLKIEKVKTDNNVFKLHYKFTVIVLIVFSILLTSKQYFGEPIDCDVDSSRKSIIDTYCWIYGTFTNKKTLNRNILSGLGNENEQAKENWRTLLEPHVKGKDDKIDQKYYQWVCIVFCFQALLFYIPRYLWKTWEGGRLKLLIKDLGGPLVNPSWNMEAKQELTKYMLSGIYSHNCYAIRFAFCEVLNLSNVILQIVLMDWFLTGSFSGYGIALATYNNINPMNVVFPKFTKCSYYNYGPSGSIQLRDALCILPLNILNEKLFLFLWFWFVILTFLSACQIMYRISVCASSKFRGILLRARCRYLSEKHTKLILNKLTYGDMFFLDLLGKNLNPIVYKELVVNLADTILMQDTGRPFNPEISIIG